MKHLKNTVVKKVCHSRKFLSGIYNACRCHNKEKALLNKCVEDPRLRLSGMTPNLMGFTLIELLVVVLIIGILAAVAVPQYQVAVAKTRVRRLMPIMQAIQQAQKEYRLANGIYADNFEALSIDMPAGGQACNELYNMSYWFEKKHCRKYSEFSCAISSDSFWTSGAIFCSIKTPAVRLSSPFGNQYWACWDGGNANSLAGRVCKAVSGNANRQSNGAWIFINN